ncbi:hypothetical protein [Marinobacter sp. C2H3]|uniref:hypothetical protein n=1 Tax=Marinobacter sp. C2H3 TaxID=3119003 RepID=UPI00300ED66B
MDPIRPDDDELRAGAPIGGGNPRPAPAAKPAPAPRDKRSGNGRDQSPKAPRGGRSTGGGRALLWFALVLVAVAAGAGWYLQQQRIKALESQLEEADYWARQSKLALARFEGELSETGESLQQKGDSLTGRIESNTKALETANSEIRKLWVVANERNKARLDEQQGQIKALSDDLAERKQAIESLSTDLAQAKKALEADLAAIKQQQQQSQEQIASIGQRLDGVDKTVEARLERFGREQSLTLDGLDGRVSALEKQADNPKQQATIQALSDKLANLGKTVDAIDASRAQLTSRLVRLSEEVDQLRARSAAK